MATGIVLQLREMIGSSPNPFSDTLVEKASIGVPLALGGIVGRMQLALTETRYIATNCPTTADKYRLQYEPGLTHQPRIGGSYTQR